MTGILLIFTFMQKRAIIWMLSVFGWATTQGVNAQATVLNAPDTIMVALDTLTAGGAVEAHWDVANETDASMMLMVTRTFLDTVSPFNYPYSSGEPGAYERFCWGPTCFNYGTDSSPTNEAFFVTLQPGQSTSTFRSDYYPNGLEGSTTLQYCFHPEGEPLGGACHSITFTAVAAASVAPIEKQPTRLVSLSPNPASEEVLVLFEQAAGGVLEFRNLVGQVIRTEAVFGGVSAQRVSVADLADGIWLVTYKVDGVAVSTKRLVIR
jgi:hypothetical protein